MRHERLPDTRTLGADLRALRKVRGLTLHDLAEALGRSVGWLSQVERDMSEPSIDDLRHMAQVFDVSVSSLFRVAAAPSEQGHIVRHSARRPIGNRADGLVEELLSPDLTDDFEVVHSTFAPGAVMAQPVTRDTQELGYVVSGAMTIWIDGTPFDVGPGDSFRIRNAAYRWANPHEVPCVVIWVIAPPVY